MPLPPEDSPSSTRFLPLGANAEPSIPAGLSGPHPAFHEQDPAPQPPLSAETCPPTPDPLPAAPSALPQDPLGTVSTPAGAAPPTEAADATRVSPSAPRREPAGREDRRRARRRSCPARVGDYDILGELGKGGMGVVYRAVQRKLKRPVALKMILAGEHADPGQIERFRAEAEAIARLRHPNIVQIYEVGEEGGRPYFSLEFVDGGSLDRYVRGNPQPAPPAAALVATLARAMHTAHQAGILHRDLKPANVLLSRKPDADSEANGAGGEAEPPLEAFEPKITDFGLAKRLDSGSEQTRQGDILGTPSYMAPEQAEGRTDDFGPATDVYALAAILYELLTGRVPFKGATVRDTLELVCTQEPVPPSRLQPKVPRDLETICLKGLCKDIRQRYASARELADDLQRWLDGRPILARRARLWERGLKYARRRPWVVGAWAAGVAALLFLLAGGGYYLYRRSLDLEAELSRQKATADTRVRASTGVSTAEDALKKRDWRGAVAAGNETLALVGDESALADLQERARGLRDAAEGVLRFTEYRDKAMFHAELALEEGDRQSHREAAQAAAREGLAVFGLTRDIPATPARFGSGLFSADVEQWLAASCYEMYLTWAEVLSPPATATPEDRRARADEALHLLDRAAQLGLSTPSFHERRAEFLQAMGEEARAKQEQEQAAALAPAHPVDHFLLGKTFYRAGNLEQARTHLQKVLEQQPDHFWASYCLAGCYLRMRPQRFERALAPLTACIHLKPTFVWSYLLRGLVNGELRDFEAAFADLEAAEKLDRDDVARYGLWVNRAAVRVRQGMDHEERARALRQRGQPGEAGREVELAAACYDAAVPELGRAVALRPQQPQAYANLAEVHLLRGRGKEARPQLDQAIALAPSARLYRTRAGLHEKRAAYAEALPDLEEAIRLARAEGRLLEVAGDQLQRGRILFRLEKYPEALGAFDEALAADPNRVKAHQLRGETLLELGRIAEAVAALDRYLEKGPPDAVASKARGLGRTKLGDYAGAVEDYTRALEIDRVEGKPADPVTLAYRGWAYLIQDAPKLALRDFDAALRLRGGNQADCYAGRGYARVQQGQWRDAVSDADAALKEEAPTARTLYLTARTYAQAAARVRTDPAQRDWRGEDLGRQYERQALHLLGRACAKTPAAERATFWKQYVEADPALRPIRGTAEFARIRSETTAPIK